jgi:hypothetical protein
VFSGLVASAFFHVNALSLNISFPFRIRFRGRGLLSDLFQVEPKVDEKGAFKLRIVCWGVGGGEAGRGGKRRANMMHAGKDRPGSSKVAFAMNWTPPSTGHSCGFALLTTPSSVRCGGLADME